MIDLPQDIYNLMLDRLTGSITDEEAVRLQEWLKASEEHCMLWREIAGLWYSGKISYTREREKDALQAWQKICKKHTRLRQRRILSLVTTVAASVVLVVGSILLFLPSSVNHHQVESITELVAGQVQQGVTLVLSNGDQVNLGKNILYEEQGVDILSDSCGIIYQKQDNVKPQDSVSYNELIVPVGGEYQLTLSDSTRVILNADTRLRFPVCFAAGKREIWISGEAYLQVAPNAKKPFIVHTEETDIRVLGTEFNVNAYQNEPVTEVTLVCGLVQVEVDGKLEELKPGYQAKVDHINLNIEKKQVNVYDYVAWKDGLLLFDDISLSQLMIRLGRWYNIHFEYRHDELKQKRFTGGFRRYDGIEKILKMIGNVNDVDFKVENGCVVIDWKR